MFVLALMCGMAMAAGPEDVAHEPFTVMGLLHEHALHDTENERWSLYAQGTYINSWKQGFPAAYTDFHGSNHSLVPSGEMSFTGTATVYLGVRLWPGADVQFVPEMISERPLSNLTGLGSAIQNFELQKLGLPKPTFYISRAFLRQAIDLGGTPMRVEPMPMQLGHTQSMRRLVFVLGNFSVLDFFDHNSYASDLRQQYLNMAFLSHAAFDFAADARGYTWGAAVEFYWDDWSVRFARVAGPKLPNQLPLDPRVFLYYGDQAEVEHDHTLWGRPGAVRLLAYRNHEHMGRFDAAIAAYQNNPGLNAATCTAFSYGSQNATAPDMCWVRVPNTKIGAGINVEQELLDGVGAFVRFMISDGETEVYSFTATDKSLSLGVLARGHLWSRPLDRTGVAYGAGFISDAHAQYLGMGGVDGFIGDGRIRQASEQVAEVFYSLNMVQAVWLTADFQHIINPAYNADRGPVDIFGLRLHVEL